MSNLVEGIRGEYRYLTSEEIGMVVSQQRGSRGIKRAVLAAQARVSEKTVERLENGIGMSEETYRRIAGALGMREDTFVSAHYIPIESEIEKALDRIESERQRNLSPVAVHRVNDVRMIVEMFGACALIVDDSEVLPAHLAQVAVLKDILQDYGDIAEDVSHSERHRCSQEILDAIQRIEKLGYEVKAGLSDCHKLPNGVSWNMAIYGIFKRREGSRETTPDEIWIARKMKVL